MRNMLIEISALNPSTKLINVVRMSAAHATAAGVYLDGKTWLPAILSDPEIGINFWSEGRPKPATVSYGQLNFALSRKLGNKAWEKLDFDGADATVWVGDLGDDFTAYRQIYAGKIGPLVPDSSREAHFSLLGAEAQLNRPALTRTYQGTGGIEGEAGMLGKLKPISFGACVNVAPVLIDPIKFVYQVDAYHAVPITAVYSSALTLDAPKATVATYPELVALDLKPGEWAACPNAGMFRLGGDPGNGKITADVGTAENAGSVARRLAKLAGILDAKLGASFTTGTRGYSLYLTEDATIGDLVSEAAFAESRLLITDSMGVLHLAPNASTKAPGTLASDGSALPTVRPDTIVQQTPASPAWQVKVAHTPVWSVNGPNEISEAVAKQAADLTAARKAADDAADLADKANATAALLEKQLEATVSDNVLDRAEKRQWIARFEAATAERAGKITEGTAQGVTAQVDAYSAAYDALNNYLGSLTPSFADTTKDTPIDGAVFRARFVNYDVALQNLLNALANSAAKTANYPNVTNRPTNLAGINAVEGDKLGGIENGATVGAPPGTTVDGRPVEQITGDIDNAKGNAQIAVDALKDNSGAIIPVKQLLDSIGDLETVYGDTASANAANAAAQAAKSAAEIAKSDAERANTEAKAARDIADGAAQTATGQAGLAAGAKVAAETARDAAQDAKRDAEAAKGLADGAKAIAEQKARDAAQSSVDANGWAVTAAGNADIAITKAGEASISEGKAAQSRADAEDFKNQAAQSATLAASTYAKALTITRNGNFDQGFDGWGVHQGPLPTIVTADPVRSNIARTEPGVATTIVGEKITVSRPDQRFKLRSSFRAVNGQVTFYIGFFMYDAADTMLAAIDGSGNYPITGGQLTADSSIHGWLDRECVIGKGLPSTPANAPYGATVTIVDACAYIRPVAYVNYFSTGGASGDLDYFTVEDVTSEFNAGTFARAASDSASSAFASEGKAGQKASAAEGSAQTAETQAGYAKSHADAAAISESNASGHAQTAVRESGVAVGAKNDAQNLAADALREAGNAGRSAADAQREASAASGFAQTASNKATEAGQKAEAAETSRQRAETEAGKADASRVAAATSEQNAGTYRNEAQSAAVVSATTASTVFPSDFSQGATYFCDLYGAPSAPVIPGNWSFPIDGAEGKILRVTNPGQFQQLRTRNIIKAVPGRKYRFEVKARRVTGANNGGDTIFVLNPYGLASDYLSVSYDGYLKSLTAEAGTQAFNPPLTQWYTKWVEFEIAANPVCPFIAPSVYVYNPLNADQTGVIVDFAYFAVTDITESSKAAGEASAAAGSSSQAKAFRDTAGSHAEAADGFRARAETEAGKADGARAIAVQAASDALGSANSAATKQTLTAIAYNKFLEADGNEQFLNGADGWLGAQNLIAVPSNYGRSNLVQTAPGDRIDGILGRKVPITSATQRLKLRVSWRCAAATAVYYFGFFMYAADGSQIYGSDGSGNYPLGPNVALDSSIHGWLDREVVVGRGMPISPYGGTCDIPAGVAYIRPVMYLNYTTVPGSITEVDYFTVEDITSEWNSASAANAASESQSKASASQGIAEQKASAASGSAETANTRAGEAKASADRAALSESNASGSESRASSSANLSVSSKDITLAEAAKSYPGFETKGQFWTWSVENGGQNGGDTAWEDHAKGAGIAFRPNIGSYLYMAPNGWTKASLGKRYRAGFYVWQYAVPSGYGGNARVYWEGADKTYSNGVYLGATASSPEATSGFYAPVPNGAWHCYASDIEITQAVLDGGTYFLRPRINIDYIPAGSGYVIAGWFWRDVTSEYKAADSASAANQSAATAGIKATDAGREASAANQSKLDAQAANGTAQGHAQTAIDQAAIATNKASAASQSQALTASFYNNTVKINGNLDWTQGLSGWSQDAYGQSEMTHPGWQTGSSWQFTNSLMWTVAGGAECFSKKRWPIDPAKRYRLRGFVGAYKTGSSGRKSTIYVGLVCYDQAGNIVNHGSYGSYRYALVTGEDYVDGRGEYREVIITGSGNDSWTKFPPGTATVAICLLANYYTREDIWTYFADFSFTDVEDLQVAKTQAQIASDSAATASAKAASATSSATLAASLSGGFINKNATFADYGEGAAAPGAWQIWNPGAVGARRTYGNGSFNDPNTGRPVEGSTWGVNMVSPVNDGAGLMQEMYGSGGKYVVDATVELRDGIWNGSGVLIYGLDINGNYISQDVVDFTNEPDAAGYTSSQLTNGYVPRRFSKVVSIAGGQNVRIIKIYAMTGWTGFTGSCSFKDMTFYKCGIKVASNNEAKVTEQQGAIAALQGKTTAYFKKTASVPGAEAFIAAEAVNDNGVATSNVAIGGAQIALYNTDNGSAKRAMYMAGGNAIFDGNLTAKAGIRIGDGTWSVAVSPKDFPVSNNQVQSFGMTLDRVPNITFGPCPVSLATGEVYRAYAADASTTGFRAVCEIVSAPVSANQSVGPGSQSIANGQGFDVGKSTPDATNGQYTFNISGYIQAYAYNDGGWNCVHIDAWLSDSLQAGDAVKGDTVLILNEALDGFEPINITNNYVASTHCVKITTVSGITLTLASDTPVTLRDGSTVFAHDLMGHDVAVLDGENFRWEGVLNIDEIGEQPVAHISAYSGTYAAGDQKGRMIFTHNIENKQ